MFRHTKETIPTDVIYLFLLLIKFYFLTVLCFISRMPNARIWY